MDWITLVSQIAFPIVACLGLAWYIKYITDKNSSNMMESNNNFTKIMMSYKDEFKDALNNNTIALTELKDYIRREDSNEIKQRGIEEKN